MNWIDKIDKIMREKEELINENKRLKERLERYEGSDIIARQIWSREDIAVQLEDKGFKPSEENIDVVISEGRIADVLSDCSDGNESICWCITSVDEKLEILEDSDE